MLSRIVGGASSLPRRRLPLLVSSSSAPSSSSLPEDLVAAPTPSLSSTTVRCFSSGNNNKKFRARRFAGKNYRKRDGPLKKPPKAKGPKDPNDVTRRIPQIDFSKIDITDVNADDEEEEFELFDPFPSTVLQMIREGKDVSDIETQLRMMDYYTSKPGSTEDLVGERRAIGMESLASEDRDEVMANIEKALEEARIENMRLPVTDVVTKEDLAADEAGVSDNQIPANQLAHGDWGEMLIRTDRVCKMWRGGRIESFRALVIGGNLNGCGGFGVGKSFEPEDAVNIASRMAKRNIFFVDRYRNRTLTRDLVGRQNSCKVVLRTTTNGLRGNPLCCEILKLMGVTDVVAKAHGGRTHHNVVRATFKALLTHESLEEIAMKRGIRLVNLQKAKRLQV